jgi:N-acetylneuraminic acid mutarotase
MGDDSMHSNGAEKTAVTGAATIAAAALATGRGTWSTLKPIPDGRGIAGSFAGVSHGALIVAGGANFPEQPLWEGGRKAWHDTVFVLERPNASWKVAGRLPRPLGYGVSATYRNTVICAGGRNETGHSAGVFRLEWKQGRLTTTALPDLRRPVANACGAVLGDVLYIVGGQVSPDSPVALASVYMLDLARPDKGWREAPPCPGGGRILATAAVAQKALWLFGGAGLHPDGKGGVTRTYLADAWRFSLEEGWKRLADLPRPLVAAPTPAAVHGNGIYLFGGDDGSKVGFTPVQEHPGFNRQVLRFDVMSGRWEDAGKLPAAPVTVPLVYWNKGWVMPGGEIRPGVRTPQVWMWKRRGLW